MSETTAPLGHGWIAPPSPREPEMLRALGKASRKHAPRSAHAKWFAADRRRDPVAILTANDAERLPQLLPVRYERMSQSPFSFYRGGAALMAHDLAGTPISKIKVMCCGDAHLLNFGGFATPERNLVFDVNDFDETCAGPWEWDLKRLATSVEIAGRALLFRRKQRKAATLACLAAYRKSIAKYATWPTLDVWFARLEAESLAEAIRSARVRRMAALARGEGLKNTSAHHYPDIVVGDDGSPHFVDAPPLVYHAPDETVALATRALDAYLRSLPPERRTLFERFRLVDVAYKVVGIGSVGTRCLVALFVAGSDDRLVLQIKEAMRSALEPYTGVAPFRTHGQRVVVGQHLLQFASDVFLGYMRADGHDYYIRQLRDYKTSANVERMTAGELLAYAELCGQSLAHAHSRASGLAAMICGYMGRTDAFDRALYAFADEYADQNSRDYDRLMDAIANGTIKVESPEGTNSAHK